MLINFFGKRGSGKTTVIKGQLDDCHGPVVVIDILGNFNEPKYVQTDDLSECILLVKDYLDTHDKSDKEKIFVLKTADPNMAVEYMSAVLWHAQGGTLILDEVDEFSVHEAPCFDQLIRYGRNKNIDLITGCRRPAEISRNITAGANQIFCFQTQEPRDIDYFRATILGEEAEKLMTLPKHSGLYADYDLNELGSFTVDTNGKIFKTKLKEV